LGFPERRATLALRVIQTILRFPTSTYSGPGSIITQGMHRASDGHPSSNLPSAHLNLDLYWSNHAPHHLPLSRRLEFLPPIHSGLLRIAAQSAFTRHSYLTKILLHPNPNADPWKEKADLALPKPASSKLHLWSRSGQPS
jgi:hypothetical protein